MIDAIRIVLVDPNARSSSEFLRQLEGVSEIDLVETCTSYTTAIKPHRDALADLVIVVTDHDGDEATTLIARLVESFPGTGILPAGEDHDASIILKVIRAGAQ